jgi:hypothetical protein
MLNNFLNGFLNNSIFVLNCWSRFDFIIVHIKIWLFFFNRFHINFHISIHLSHNNSQFVSGTDIWIFNNFFLDDVWEPNFQSCWKDRPSAR